MPSSVGVSVSFRCCTITFLLSRLVLSMFSNVRVSWLWEVIPIIVRSSDVSSQVSSLFAAMAGRR